MKNEFDFIQHNMPVENGLDDYILELIAKLCNALISRFIERKQILERIDWYDEKTKRVYHLTWEERK